VLERGRRCCDSPSSSRSTAPPLEATGSKAGPACLGIHTRTSVGRYRRTSSPPSSPAFGPGAVHPNPSADPAHQNGNPKPCPVSPPASPSRTPSTSGADNYSTPAAQPSAQGSEPTPSRPRKQVRCTSALYRSRAKWATNTAGSYYRGHHITTATPM
jgi:hypothetical protein